jgi:hypothetical protein
VAGVKMQIKHDEKTVLNTCMCVTML